MRIAVNTRLLLPGKLEGLGRFANETLKRITQRHPEHEFIFIFDRKPDAAFIFSNNIIPVIAYPQARHPLLWYLFFEYGVNHVLRKHKADLFLSPDGWLSLRAKIPSIAVIHDLNFFHNREWVSTLPRMYYDYFFPRYIHRAQRIATVSEYSRSDISSQFGIPPDRIDVVYNGVNSEFHSVSKNQKDITRTKYSSGAPYFLFLGLVHPRKNLTRIIEAYTLFRRNTQSDIRFVIAGSTKYQTEDTARAFKKSPYRNDIIFTGRIQESELNNLIGSSLCLVYTSLFEGFGIPILEAMQCKVPVITSNVTSMPEVGGDAVYYADPYSARSIADGMQTLASDEKLRNQLIGKGTEQLKKFSWDNTAEKLWESLEKVIRSIPVTS
jgi:glycosyltransferase involved in cell wall biosynthesis